MRILHVIPSLAPCHGGPSVVLPIMERALAVEGVTVETVLTDDNGPGLRNGKCDGAVRTENGVLRRYFPKQLEFYKVSRPMGKWLRSELVNYDLVHIHALFQYASIMAARAARVAGVPYVIRPLGVLNRYGITQRRARLKRWSMRWIEGPLLRDAAAIHFTLDAERFEAEQLGISFNSVVIPLGIEPQVLPEPSPDRSPSVLFLSRIDKKKNIESLLEAWVGIAARNPEWRLIIAGRGVAEYEGRLKVRSKSLGIEDNVDWVGHVEGERKAQLLADSTVYTLPSHSENFGIAAAEALQAGKPCVFTPGVAVGALASKRGAAILAEPDSRSLGLALSELISDSETRRLLGAAAKRFAEDELAADVMGRRLKQLYHRLVNHPST